MARKMTVAERKAVWRRMKRYCAEKRRSKQAKETAATVPAPTKPSMTARVISRQDGLVLSTYDLASWGAFYDLIHEKYLGIPIDEILITIH